MFLRGPFRNKQDLVLASKSPRRQSLLASLGIHFYVQPSKVKEPNPEDFSTPKEYAQATALLKAQEVSKSFPHQAILSADTIVVKDKEILGKPRDFKQALAFLEKLAGTSHEVITGVCLLFQREQRIFSVETEVIMEKFSPEILKAYVLTREPMDKAGAYGIQGIGGFLVKEIKGSYSNVVGLPLTETVKNLLELEIIGLEENE
ncbi:MAG: nucleoside triphosphate pyrophosphatase [Desulfonauticus sp.]|jgi:septum formation protein|nr:nucleoside triphosphate pyrophosphatase [Desulfonauticus sp.]